MAEIKDYSVTADDNDSGSPNGMPEGMAPSGVNNSWRESFARVKRWYEDISAAKTTTGSSNAYVLAAARVVTAYAAGDAYMIKANHTCTSAGSTLNIDSVGAKSIVTPAGAALGAGDITSGGIYIVAYEASADKFMLLAGGSTFSGDITAKTSDGAILNLQTSDTTVTSGSVLGRTDYQAPDEASGTDAILLAASIAAISEGTFAADNNATKLSFMTAASSAAAEVMSISSVGNVTMKQTATTDDTPMTLLLQTGETDIAANDVLGKIEFQAPDEAAGTDAILVAAAIDAVSEGDFSSSSNATKLSFRTGASETATEKMSLDSAGTLLLTSTLASASVGPKLYLTRTSASPADNDLCGDIIYTADNDAGEDTTLVQMYATLLDATNGSEDASLILQTVENGSYVASCQFKGSGIQVPDGGNVGSVTTPTAIDILGTGEIGIGAAGYTSAQTYIYDNTTGRLGLRLQLANASSTQMGLHCSTAGAGVAVYGSCAGAHWGVYGLSAANYGVYSQTQSASYGGCFGLSANSSHYGILGHANTHGVYGTSVYCVGALYKGSGTFRISHPLKSEIEDEPWDLCHSFIEGPQCDLIYRGKVDLVDGQASIDIDSHYDMTPGTFEWLTKADEVQTFTSNETGWDAVRSSFSGDTITIECQNSSSTDTISWMVIAERGDPNIIESTITDDEGNLLIERPSEPEPPSPGPPPSDP